jgi:hypothetical protein
VGLSFPWAGWAARTGGDGMDVIQTTLEQITRKLNESIGNAIPGSGDWAILSNLVDHEGRPYEAAKNKIVVFLANIQHETVISTYRRTVPAGDVYAAVAPPLYINFFVLCIANFYDKNYADGLGMISRTISFFQQNPCFTHENLPGLDPVIDKLTFDITNLDLVDLNYLISMTGTKYLPSVYYKVRLIPFQSGAMQAEVPVAKGVETPGKLEEGPARIQSPTDRAAKERGE